MDLSKFIKEYLACDDDPDCLRTLVANWKSTPGLFETVKKNGKGVGVIFGIKFNIVPNLNGQEAIQLSRFIDAKNSKSWIWIREDNAMSCGTGYEL